MLDLFTALLAPKTRALTESEVNAIIDELGPSNIADIVDAYAAQAAATGLDPIADHIAGQVFERCGPVIDAIAAIGTGIAREKIAKSGQLFRIACAHQTVLATFPGRSLEEILQHIVYLAVAKARETSVFSSGSDRRH